MRTRWTAGSISPTALLTHSAWRRFDTTDWLRMHLTTTTNEDLGKRGGLARRKHLCNSWYNNEWLARTLAIVQTLWTEEGIIRAGDVVVDGWPIFVDQSDWH